MMRCLVILMLTLPALSLAAGPPCANWPANMALVHLKNAGITDPAKVDDTRTTAVLLASQKIGRDLYRQVYDITFHEKSGVTVEVITASDASSRECSMSGVEVYVVSRKIGDHGR